MMLKAFLILLILLGALCLFISLKKATKIYIAEKRVTTLSLIPTLIIFLIGYFNFLLFLFKSTLFDQVTIIVSTIFFAGGLFCVIVLNIIQNNIVSISNDKNIINHGLTHHSVSGLPNRIFLINYLNDKIKSDENQFAILSIVINNFTSSQEVFGLEHTENLIKVYSKKIKSFIGEDISVFHSQNNAFCLIIPCTNKNYLEQFANDIYEHLDQPVTNGKISLGFTANIGIEVFPNENYSSNDLLQRSELAAFQAIRIAKPVLFFSKNLSSPFNNNAELLVKLQQAIASETFRLHFQRLHCVDLPNTLCFEVLIRWPIKGGFVSPAEFIPLAEQSNNIQSITRWVLAKSIAQLEIWKKEKIDVSLHINLSSKDIADLKLISYLEDLLKSYKIDPSQLTLELTETSMMQNVEHSKEVLNLIKKLGVKISIDDYGSGFSSLSILSEMPIDEIKIDRSFVTHLLNKKTHEAIVRSTVNLAHSLNCKVVAEGVECSNVANFLVEIGCDKLQGFHFSKPLSLEETNYLIKENNSLETHCIA